MCQGGPCSCKKLCYSKFTDDERKRIFTLFWELGDKSIQDAYLHGLIRVRKIARRRARKSAPVKSRSASFIYVIRANGDERIVCRQAFINMHGITAGRVQHISFYARTSPTPPVDKRGKQPNPHATEHNIKQQIREHINLSLLYKAIMDEQKEQKKQKAENIYLHICLLLPCMISTSKSMKLKNMPKKMIEIFVLHMTIIVNISIPTLILVLAFPVLTLVECVMKLTEKYMMLSLLRINAD